MSRDSAPPEVYGLPSAGTGARPTRVVDAAIVASVRRFASEHGLTPAETRILELAVDGMTRTDIVSEAGISVHTYQKHVRAIRDKSGEAIFQAAIRVLRGAVARAPRPAAAEPAFDMLLS
ncbi:MAG: hypothetical protein AAGH15_20575 [Myxococcota bacterium]